MMRSLCRAAAVLAMLCAAACQGSYSSGPQIPNTVPSGGAGAPAPNPTTNPASNSQSAPPPGTLSFAFADAAHGFTCPASGGFACTLRLNAAAETPAPSASPSGSPRPSASPSPSPSPAPSVSPSASPAGSPTPEAGTFAVTVSALPKDAPKMVITKKDAPPTVAVMMLTLVPSADFALDGRAVAEFTLPKEQVTNRGFAIQLFEETVRHKRHDVHPLYTLAKSTLVKQTLTFSMTPPKLTLPKGRKYFIVLFGDALAPGATPTPGVTLSPAPSPSPLPSPPVSPSP